MGYFFYFQTFDGHTSVIIFDHSNWLHNLIQNQTQSTHTNFFRKYKLKSSHPKGLTVILKWTILDHYQVAVGLHIAFFEWVKMHQEWPRIILLIRSQFERLSTFPFLYNSFYLQNVMIDWLDWNWARTI